MVLDRAGCSVAEQVAQLAGDVPVVDVERGDPAAEAAEQALQVLGPVVQVLRHKVLAGLVAGQRRARGVQPEPAIGQVAGQAAGSVHQLGERPPDVAVHDGGPVRYLPCGVLDQTRDVELDHQPARDRHLRCRGDRSVGRAPRAAITTGPTR